jgi:hypothetical protein
MSENVLSSSEFLWKPLFEAAAQTLVGAISSYSFGKILSRVYESNIYEGGMDIWVRGVHTKNLNEGDNVTVDGLLSPYVQLFPGDPTDNARRWNSLHSFPGKITSAEYQTLEFFAGSDAALRIGGINGETIVGIYNRYGFVGDGMVGVVPTKLLLKSIPDAFEPGFVGVHARIGGHLAKCPSQHAFVAQSIAASANMPLDIKRYRHLPYLQINSVKPYSSPRLKTNSLLGTAWVATHLPSQQYVTEYGYFNNVNERQECIARLFQSKAWKKASVYFDDISCPSKSLSFKQLFF